MAHILHKLYYGNINPFFKPSPTTEEYKNAVAHLVQSEDKLLAMLNDEGKAHYDKLLHYTSKRDAIEHAFIFEDGFKLGAQITYAGFVEDKLD